MCRSNCWCIANSPLGCMAFPIGLMQICFVIYCTIKYIILEDFGTSYLGIANLVFFGIVSVLALWSELATVFTNPGAIPKSLKLDKKTKFEAIRHGQQICEACNSLRPIRAYHCTTCKTCVLREDHHCPYVHKRSDSYGCEQ